MNVFPVNISKITQREELPTETYKIDFENGRISGRITGKEAVYQFIYKTLITPRFDCFAYNNQYGSELKALIGSNSTREFIESEIPRIVRDGLLVDSRILEIRDFSFEFVDDECFIAFTADTVYGDIAISEVV